jgi:CheY-like chemotaxis protein/anti-sigma regulatory factor (Ser/Thr protein kinase)
VKSQILVIDDEKEICELLQVALEMAGHGVRYSTTADGGLELARRERFDLAIVDMVMPNRDGLEVLEELQTAHPDILVIVITGLHSTDLLRRALDMGAFGVLAKPFTLADIVALIELGNTIRGSAPSLQTLGPVMRQTIEFRLPTIWPVTLEIPAYLRDIARALDFPRIISDRNVPMTVHELIQNATIHGNRRKENTTVTVRAAVADRTLTIEVEDQGKGFDPTKVIAAQAAQSSEAKGWGGLFIVKCFADNLTFEKNGRLARVTFKAIRSPKKAASRRAIPAKA